MNPPSLLIRVTLIADLTRGPARTRAQLVGGAMRAGVRRAPGWLQWSVASKLGVVRGLTAPAGTTRTSMRHALSSR